jgi:hypothetical protein
MKANIGSALANIAHGFAASYSTALSTLRGISRDKSDEPTKPMVNTAISGPVAQAINKAPEFSDDLKEGSSMHLVA